MSRKELMDALHEARLQLAGADDLRHVVEELSVHQEELRQQQHELSSAQRELEISRDGYAELFDFAPIGYVTLDGQGAIQEINFTGGQMLGIERKRLEGVPFIVYVSASDRRKFLDVLARCRRGERRVRTELSLRGDGDVRIPVELTIRQVANRARPPRLYCSFSDQREREQLEEERHRAADDAARMHEEQTRVVATNEAKDRFLAVLSHELRSPLSPIVFGLAALEHMGDLPPGAVETLALIRRNVDLEARLIDDLLDVTRISHGKLRVELEEVELHGLLESVAAMCRAEFEAKEQKLTLDLTAERSWVLADPTRLRQIAWNLVLNASRATPRQGAIAIRTRDCGDGRVSIAVEDNGPGVAPQDLGRIFAAFEQADANERPGGLGLGLAITKGLVEAHHGTISVTNLSPGARFEVLLDTIEPTSGSQPRIRASAIERQPRAVLLVEDHPDTADMLARLLAANGCRVQVAHSVAEALAVPDDAFEIVLSDLQLPDASGLDLMQRLQERRAVPGIAMSGFGFDHDVRRSLDAGFSKHLIKPVTVEDVLEAIDEVAGRARQVASGIV
jgi:PAS domain S-box-containing protein